jgi:hypothetical protein
VPRDPYLAAAVDAFCEKQFGEVHDFRPYLRAWAVVLESAPECYEVLAVGAGRNTPDFPVFHVAEAEERDGRDLAREATACLMGRMRSFCEDNGFRRKTVLIYVAEKAQKRWASFLRMIGAKSADRFEVEI